MNAEQHERAVKAIAYHTAAATTLRPPNDPWSCRGLGCTWTGPLEMSHAQHLLDLLEAAGVLR